MTEPRGVRFERAGDIGKIVLARPEAANSLDLPAARALAAAIDTAAATDVRVITLTGEGTRFCAGGDVASFVAADDRADYLHQLASELETQLRRLSELPVPVVAGVHGAVAGAGLAFVLHADVVVAARSTKFVLAYSGIGLTPDCGVSYLLPRAVGSHRAANLAVTGRVLSAAEALDWGLVAEVVDDGQIAQRVDELAAAIAEKPVGALSETARLMRESWESTQAESAADEAATIARMVQTPEAQLLIERFLSR
ncbi:Enoyl-CoA hydratase (fragment) [metagenome]|uniref:Enoyl-CoA hydratase n=1 Tax=metagenome TaxID=256318 RepID=A0A2P2C0T4_9ZZZZ